MTNGYTTKVRIIGAGLAGCEAALTLANRGIPVALYDMKPGEKTPAHSSDKLCELVCSNSLRSSRLENAAGLLKEELRRLGSELINAADKSQVPAGGALAVDRERFSTLITERVLTHKNIEFIEGRIDEIGEPPVIIATGPLTDGKLMDDLEERFLEPLHFFDAAAPIVSAESIDMNRVFQGSRYDRGDDYLNCPMTREEYFNFVHALQTAETVQLHGFEGKEVFEGCMPIEVMAKRGDMTLAFGPLKPVGISYPEGYEAREEGFSRPFAVVQLRREDEAGTHYNIVGFQTNLKFSEQRRVFSMIPGLENAEFTRLGVMHRNTFLNSPGKLDRWFCSKNTPGLFVAGQITGVEGYIESIASGFVAGLSMYCDIVGKARPCFTGSTAIGALGRYVSEYSGHDFQPQNINFGIIEPLSEKIRNKHERYGAMVERALGIIDAIAAEF